MKNAPTIILFFLLLILESCGTIYNYRPLSIEVLLPAKEYFPPSDTTIASLYINSNFKNDSLSDINIVDGKIVMDTFLVDSLASIVYYNSFIDSLKKQKSFDSIADLGKTFPKIGKSSIAILGASDLDSMYKIYPFNSMCSLSQFNLNENINTFYDYGYIEIKYVVTSLWGIYTQFGLKYIILNNDSVVYTVDMNQFNYKQFLNNDRRMLIKEASADIAYKFAGSMTVHWETAQRLYYNSGNYQFKQADKYAQNNEWLKAAEVWQELTKNKNKNIAAKSMYNMAIACEMQSDYDAAIDWVAKSFHVFGNKNDFHSKNCLDYIEILATRRLEAKKIKEQQGLPDY